MFKQTEIKAFQRDGYIIARDLAEEPLLTAMKEAAQAALVEKAAPIEYEEDVPAPTAPVPGDPDRCTVRRLLQAYARHPVFRKWATSPALLARLRVLLGPRLLLTQAHHNCIMTKQPEHSKATAWHQDIRYWSFGRPELVNVWLALGPEFTENGCLSLLPGSHTMSFARERLDEALFLRPDLPENQALIATRITAELHPGDALFFHCRTFHGAGRNCTAKTKFSVVFSYHSEDNLPVPGTRSASTPEIAIEELTDAG